MNALIFAALLAIVTAIPGAPTQSDAVTIEYIAHASFLVRSPSGTEVLIDPYASRVWLGYDFPAGLTPDAVLITHPHYDHDGGQFRGGEVWWNDDMRVVDAPGRHQIGDKSLGCTIGQSIVCAIECVEQPANYKNPSPSDAV